MDEPEEEPKKYFAKFPVKNPTNNDEKPFSMKFSFVYHQKHQDKKFHDKTEIEYIAKICKTKLHDHYKDSYLKYDIDDSQNSFTITFPDVPFTKKTKQVYNDVREEIIREDVFYNLPFMNTYGRSDNNFFPPIIPILDIEDDESDENDEEPVKVRKGGKLETTSVKPKDLDESLIKSPFSDFM